MTIENGSVSELAGLLVVEPPKGDAEAQDDRSLPEDTGTEHQTDPDWNDDDGDDGNPDDGTDAGDPSDADDGQVDGGEDDGPYHDVVVNGQTVRVSQKELIEGYSRQSDYTRKTQEVADARKNVDTELEQMRAHRAQYKQALDDLQKVIGPADQEPTAEQWNELRINDPDKYAVEYADYLRRQEARRTVEEEKKRIADEETKEQVNTLRKFVDNERTALQGKMLPYWKGKDGKLDPEKASKSIQDIRDHAMSAFGFTTEEMDKAYDHRMIVMAHKAMLWDRAEKARKAAAEKLAKAPDMPAPGARVTPRNGRVVARDEAQKKFDKSGRVDDAVDLMFK